MNRDHHNLPLPPGYPDGMRTLLLLASIFAGLWLAVLLPAAPGPISLSQYIAELKSVQNVLEAQKPDVDQLEQLIGNLPEAWVVQADDHSFSVSARTITVQITQYCIDSHVGSRDKQSLADARRTVDSLLANATSMTEEQADGGERARLDEILSRSEFSRDAGESWWDRLKQKAQQLLLRLLGSMVSSSSFPIVSRIVIWVVVVTATALLAFWVVRNYLKSGTYTTLSGIPGVISEKPWRDWHAEAKAAAEQGHWREAVHLSYWAGISFLEGQGLWRPDRARTPREYLRLLPPTDDHRNALAELTRGFETVWYGNEQATEREFAATTALLERLGCH